MELKRVLAADTRSAKDKALNLYGADALILSNEKVNGMVEIIVAVDLTQDDLGENIRQCPAVTVPSTATTTALVAPPHFGHVLQSTMQRMQKGQQQIGRAHV